jgi:tetratricopeptide (TPR) repeat protein
MTEAPAIAVDPLREKRLRSALEHLNRGELADAEGWLSLALESDPSDAQALQLLGSVRRYQGQLDEAERLLRLSLSQDPNQPNVHCNLGNVLGLQGRFHEAAESHREAIRLKPNYAEAYLNLALTQSALGDHEGAEKSCRSALRIQPNYLYAKQTLASELNDLGRPQEAERILRQALMAGSRNPRQVAALQHNLGVSLKQQRRYQEALACLDAARNIAPDLPLVEFNRGDALQFLGRLGEAAEAFSKAVQANPLDVNTHEQLNKVLYRLGDDANFLRSFDDVAALYPDNGLLPLKKGNLQYLKEDFAGARESFERAARLLPEASTPHVGLALVLARTGELDAAIREHEIANSIDPNSVQSWRSFAETLLRARDPAKARAAAEKALALDPHHQATLATWGLALRLLNDPLEEKLNDYERLVRVYELDPPDGYSDMEAFNRDLNLDLDRLHFGQREFIDQTLRAGTQTLENLFGSGLAHVGQLRAKIDGAVADYIAQMKDEPSHPLFARKSKDFSYNGSWSARLHDCGYHTNHVHPDGWISSAYYVSLPDVVAESKSDDGWIKFGEPNFDSGIDNPIRRKVQPRSGTLVLFPSYMWHGTVPFHSAQSRTSVAFDVAPKKS